jgi:hypothetical protein
MALILVAAAIVVGQPPQQTTRANSNLIFEDSAYVLGTATKTMRVCWQDGWANKAILIEANDTSNVGLTSDSAAVRVTAYQVFPFTSASGYKDLFCALNSRANPDSTTKYGSSVFNLFDSLDIKSMDTASVYLRNRVTLTMTGGAPGTAAGDSLKTLQTPAAGYGAFAYTALPFDFSPAFVLKLKGLEANKKGKPSFWRVRVYALRGIPQKVQQ